MFEPESSRLKKAGAGAYSNSFIAIRRCRASGRDCTLSQGFYIRTLGEAVWYSIVACVGRAHMACELVAGLRFSDCLSSMVISAHCAAMNKKLMHVLVLRKQAPDYTLCER
jgi:hypothetical protein